MSNEQLQERAYNIWLLKFKKNYELVEKIISVYMIFSNKPKLRQFEKDLLNLYIRHGISKETRDLAMEELQKPRNLIIQIAHHLRKKGYIYKKKTGHWTEDLLPKELRVGTEEFCDYVERISEYTCLMQPRSTEDEFQIDLSKNIQSQSGIEILEVPILRELKNWDLNNPITQSKIAEKIDSNHTYVGACLNKYRHLDDRYKKLKLITKSN